MEMDASAQRCGPGALVLRATLEVAMQQAALGVGQMPRLIDRPNRGIAVHGECLFTVCERWDRINKAMRRDHPAREQELLREVAEAAGHHGLQLDIRSRPPRSPGGAADALVRVHHPEGVVDLVAEVKTHLTAGALGAVAAKIRRSGRPAVLVADYVDPKLAERLREQGVFFLDGAGNAFVRDRGLYIFVTGRRNEAERQRFRQRVRAFRPSGLKLIFALLSKPELVEADFRTMAQATGVALGTVQWVMRDLVAASFVRRVDRTHRVLARPEELLESWAQGFAQELRPRLLLGRFAAADVGWWKQTDPAKYGSLWGGEPAGARLTGFLKPGTLTLYADAIPARLLIDQRLKRAEDGEVEVLRKFWRFTDDNEERGVVPDVLAYADLLALGDSRTVEAANRLFAGHLDGSFRSYLARTPG